MPAARFRWLLPLLILGLAPVACANPFAPQTIPTAAVLPSLPPVTTDTATPPVTAGPSPAEIPMTPYTDRWYQVLHPVGWQGGGGYLPNEWSFTPPDQPEPQYGVRVRFEGTGYSFSVLDALINSEMETMRREGLAPQEVAIRRADELAAGQAASRSADFLGTVGSTPVRIQVTAVVANFTAAYVVRLWAPLAVYDSDGYAAAFARVVREFTPLYTPDITATFTLPPPTETETPTTAPPTETPTVPIPATATGTPSLEPSTPTPAPTLAAPTLGTDPYRASAFTMAYPAGWTPTTNIDGSVTFLSNDPTLLVGISASVIGASTTPDGDALALLEAYLAEVASTVPDAVIGEQRVEESAGDQARGFSATYVVPYSDGRLVYRVTTLVAQSTDGTAYRILQWAPEALYEAVYRDLYRAVVSAFRPVSAATSQEGP